MRDYGLFIAGEWLSTDQRAEVTNPYTGAVVGHTAVGIETHAEQAVDAAAAAMRETPPPQHERAAVLERARELVAARAEDFAETIALEAGKPITTARKEVSRAGDTLLLAATEARKLAGAVIPMEGLPAAEGKLAFTLSHPKGVVAAITPFNFPLNLVLHKLAPAFAAGCPIVHKPAGDTPLTALLLAETLHEAGWPPGYLSTLTGRSSVLGPAITAREEVAVVTFTGSTEVGHQLAAQNPRKAVLLELGSNSPAIVDAAADVELAASRLAATAYGFAGQSCISAQRVYVDTGVKDAFLEALTAKVSALTVGDPMADETDVGPLIRPEERDRVLSWVRDAEEAGAKLRLGGEVNEDGTLAPTVLDEVTQDMKVSCEEVFGPVLALHPVDDLDEAIRLSNDSRYGLHAGIFTNDYTAAMRAARELVFGGVLVNESPTFRADVAPYGGVRDSGNTREGPPSAIGEYLEETTVILQAD
jgi:acyl-CoA reductase-like NAD-dependent aldehyde dehydrogenase